MRIFLISLVLAGFVFSCSAPGEDLTPPNVVILFTDDQRHSTINAWGYEELITPNMDRLANEGVSFTRAHVAGSIHGAVCSPSRAMLLSGRSFFSIPRGFMGGGGESKLPFITMPEHLRQNGYNTFFTGKWHNSTYLINDAFSHVDDLYIGGMHWPRDGGHDSPLLQGYDPNGVYPSSEKKPVEQFSSEIYTDAAIQFIEEHGSEKPFMIYVAYTSPHDPRMAPEKYTSMYNPETLELPKNFLPQHPFDNGDLRVRDEMLQPFPRTPDAIKEDIAAYYAMVTEVDDNIGRLLDVLDEKGLDKNTIVVFAGDNGLAMGQHGLLGKQSLYDHSSRVPLIIRGPGVEKGRNNSLVYLYDVFPTICEMIGLPTPESVQGKSLTSAMNDNELALRDHIFTAYRNTQRAIRTKDDLKLIKYNVNGELHTQLFDIAQDPWETKDLTDNPSYAVQQQQLSELLTTAILDHGDRFLTPEIISSYSTFEEGPAVSITKSFDDVQLSMTADGSEPTISSMSYETPFILDTSATLKVRAFYKKEPVSEVIERRVTVIDWVRDAQLDTEPAPRYSKGGIFTLLDGERGTLQHGGGKWLGFQDNRLSANVDLGKVKQINSIHLGCLTSPGSWIFWPEQVRILISPDGENWTTYYETSDAAEAKDQSSEVKDLGATKSASARYVRIEAIPLNSIPEWHDGKGSKGWLFVDEIRIDSE